MPICEVTAAVRRLGRDRAVEMRIQARGSEGRDTTTEEAAAAAAAALGQRSSDPAHSPLLIDVGAHSHIDNSAQRAGINDTFSPNLYSSSPLVSYTSPYDLDRVFDMYYR